MENKVNALFKELDEFWNASEDERFKGEHPDCSRLQDEIKEVLSEMDEEAICDILDSIAEKKLEQIQSVLEDMVDDKPFLDTYIQ